MTARDDEAETLARCALAAGGFVSVAVNQREANVFRLASMVIQSRFPDESIMLMRASDSYFSHCPNDLLPPQAVLRNGWVFNLPRLRDMLSLRLR